MTEDSMDHQQSAPQPGDAAPTQPPSWGPLSSVQRRVLGVMVEKSKTTPDIYPMTANAIATGSNQKNNRKPQMQLTADDVIDALSDLRDLGAVTEIHGDGRSVKYRHHLYEWLGVDRVELAVMAELFLRGEQTVGDLRGRTSRMEKIPDMAALKPVLLSLTQKKLVFPLTPPGRGQKLTHNLYLPEQLAKLQREYGESGSPAKSEVSVKDSTSDRPESMGADVAAGHQQTAAESQKPADWSQLQDRLAALEERVARLERQL